MIIILTIVLEPIIKFFTLFMVFNISAALLEPISDKRIIKCLNATSDSIKILLALLGTTCILFLLSISLMLKMSNFSIMY